MSSALLIPRSVRPNSTTRNPTPERLSCEHILNYPQYLLTFAAISIGPLNAMLDWGCSSAQLSYLQSFLPLSFTVSPNQSAN